MRKTLYLVWIAFLGSGIFSGCVYHPDYVGARCSADGRCPPGLICQMDSSGVGRCLPPDGGGEQEPYPPDADGGADAADEIVEDIGEETGPCINPDADSDGHLAMACGGDDCDDSDPEVYLGAAEICDGKDNDCDGFTDGDDDGLRLVWCEKQYGVCSGSKKAATLCRQGAWIACTGQDYLRHSVKYEEIESSCDGLDNDCDGVVDEDLVAPSCPLQQGVCAGSRRRCLGAAGWKQSCDVQEYGSAYQTQETLCDGLDNDCDGRVDGLERPCSAAHLGKCAEGMETCSDGTWQGCPEPEQEQCDVTQIDEDCDGSINEGCGGCQTNESRLCPLQSGVCSGAREHCIDGQWSGCDYQAHSAGKYQPPPETLCDGLDNDCDGTVDGITRSCAVAHQGLCAIGQEQCFSGMWQGCPQPQPEICDGVDNDCDGLVDAADGDLVLSPCELQQGVCAGGFVHRPEKCSSGVWQLCDSAEYGPAYGAENCTDNLDNDCDGLTDCGPPQCENQVRPCQNQCLSGKSTCRNGLWGPCLPEVAPEAASNGNCNDSLDNDCDGPIDCQDSGCEGAERVCYNQCHVGRQVCHSGNWTQCNAAPVVDERPRNGNCNDGIDNDCDGRTDGDDDLCCGTAGITGALVMLIVWPLGLRRWLRRWLCGSQKHCCRQI